MKKSNKILILLTFLLTVCIGGFFICTLDFYSADYRHNNYYDLQLNIPIKKDLLIQVIFYLCIQLQIIVIIMSLVSAVKIQSVDKKAAYTNC